MKITDQTAIRVQIGLAVATLCAVATLAWNAAAISTKIDALWADYLTRHNTVASLEHK